MDRRRLVAAAVLAALMLAQSAHGQPLPGSAPLPIGLGYSQGSIAPVGSGIPVYAVGDQLWFRSYASGPVNATIVAPGSGTSVVSANIPGNTSEDLFSFSNTDAAGAWTLTASTQTQRASVRFYLVAGGAPVALSGYGVGAGGILTMNYTLGSESAYSVSACTAGSLSTATVYAPVPVAVGGGALLLTLNGSSVSVIPQSSTGSFTFSLSLSQDYAYQLNGTTAVVTKDVQVAQTEPVQVVGGITGSFSTALSDALPMRTGEFSLSASFEGPQGVSIFDTSVLVTGTGSWVWLQGCANAPGSLSTTVAVTASLQEGPAAWPREVYVLYQELGVGLFSIASVDIQPATVQLVASQWGRPLTDSQIEVSGAVQYSEGNGTVFIVGSDYPVNVTVSTPQTAPQRVDVNAPYSVNQVEVPADQVVVRTLSGGTGLTDAQVTLKDSDGTVAAETSTDGAAVFYVPPGNYTVSGSFDGSVESSNLTVHEQAPAGQSLPVTLQFGSAANTWLTYILLVALGAGAIVSAIVWGTVYARMGRSPRTSRKENRGAPEGTNSGGPYSRRLNTRRAGTRS